MMRMPAAWQRRDRLGAPPGAGGSSIATRPSRHEVAFGVLAVARAARASSRRRADGEHPQALAGLRGRRPARSRGARRVERLGPAVGVHDRGAAGQHRLGGALGVHPACRRRARRRWTCSFSAGIEVKQPQPRGAGAPSVERRRRGAAAASSMRHLGRVARRVRRRRRGAALLHAVIAAASGRAPRRPRRGPRGRSESRACPRPVQTAVDAACGSRSACRSCRCRSRSVEPSVSTALSRLTTRPRRASPRTPTARASVMTGSSPSGTLPTSRPIANTTASRSGRSGAEHRDRHERHAERRPRSPRSARPPCAPGVSSGLSSRPTRSDSAAIRPSSVRMPVAKTTARASPSGAHRAGEHQVPRLQQGHAGVDEVGRAEHRQRLAGERRQIDLDAALDAGGRRREIRSPSSISSTSPGTSSAVDAPARRPSRSTLARTGRYPASASTARSACSSCANANAALRRITTTIATATDVMPAAQASAGGGPQQQGQRVGELAGQLPRPLPAAAAAQLVRAVVDAGGAPPRAR